MAFLVIKPNLNDLNILEAKEQIIEIEKRAFNKEASDELEHLIQSVTARISEVVSEIEKLL